MKLEVIKEKDFPLLSRKRVSLWFDEKGATPPRMELTKEIAKMFKKEEELVVIRHIYPQMGSFKQRLSHISMMTRRSSIPSSMTAL
jgi:ribosomal protein S24E